MIVVEAVDHSARNAQYLARTNVGLSTVEGQGQHALKSVDRLLITVMAVRSRHSGSGWDVDLEDCDGTSRRLALEQESDRQLPKPDLFASARHPEYPPLLLSFCLAHAYPCSEVRQTRSSLSEGLFASVSHSICSATASCFQVSENRPSRQLVNRIG
jgi:hypothetical protein